MYEVKLNLSLTPALPIALTASLAPKSVPKPQGMEKIVVDVDPGSADWIKACDHDHEGRGTSRTGPKLARVGVSRSLWIVTAPCASVHDHCHASARD